MKSFIHNMINAEKTRLFRNLKLYPPQNRLLEFANKFSFIQFLKLECKFGENVLSTINQIVSFRMHKKINLHVM